MELLDGVVLPYIESLEDEFGEEFTFQHDNAPAHDAISVVGREYQHERVIGWFEEVQI